MYSRAISLNQRFRSAQKLLSDRLFSPVDIASLVFFRIAFGSIMLWEIWRFFSHGWISQHFVGKDFYFKYWPFEFVQPWPGDGMFIHFGIMAVFAACIVLGLFYRVSAAAFFLMFTYVFLLERAVYLNHFYLVCLFAFVMIFVPAHRHFSLDALLRPTLRSSVVPGWSVWLLRFQLAIPMFFGGVAKINTDWLRGEPLRDWLAHKTDFPLLGQYFTDEPVVWLMVYGGLLIDLLFVFYILNRRTRVFGFLIVFAFHMMNARLFDIGIFPWLMIASTLIFFDPGWPRRVLHDLIQGHTWRSAAFIGGFGLGYSIGAVVPDGFSLVHSLVGAIGLGVAAFHIDEPFRRPEATVVEMRERGGRANIRERRYQGLPAPEFTRLQKGTLAILVLWVGFQVLIPLRQFAIPGNVHWTEEGHRFSWHMLLRDKSSRGFFLVTDSATGEEWKVDPGDYLTRRQEQTMVGHPDMVLQFARYLGDRMGRDGYPEVEIRANITSSLNGRPPQQLIDPNVDLLQVSNPWYGHADWILHLEPPLRSTN